MTSWRLVWNFIFFLLRGGFRKHEENKKGDLGGANLRLAQFYKDVEMAEVMTDNDHAVAEILASYEIADTGDGEDELQDQAAKNVIPDLELENATKSGEVSSSNSEKSSCRKVLGKQHEQQPEVAKMVNANKRKKVAKMVKPEREKKARLVNNPLTEIKNGRVGKNNK